MADRASARSVMGGVLREPTFHFVLLALSLFAVNAAVRSRHRGDVIEIDRGRVTARIARIEASLGVLLTAEERRRVQEDYIDEQVLVSEARALGLQDDPQVHDLLAQKMLDVLSADVLQPTEVELQAYYEADRRRYATEAAVTVDEVVVGTTDTLPVALRDQLRSGVAPQQLATDLPMRYSVLAQATPDDLTRVFGTWTAELIFGAQPGEWVGPHPSARGQHWFRVTARTGSASQPLEAVREQVRLDWIGEQEQVRLRHRVSELRDRYAIVFIGKDGTS